MSNAVLRWERRIADTVNVAFFYRAMIYLMATIFAFVIIPPEAGSYIFPDPKWFFLHFTMIALLSLLSLANYPDHMSGSDIRRRVAAAILPPSLFLVAIKDRWEDLKILIKRDEYGGMLLVGVIGSAGLILFFYTTALVALVADIGLYYLVYVIVYNLLVLSPMFVLDTIQLVRSSDTAELIPDWEQSTITGEQIPATKPPLYRLLNTRRKRVWLFFLLNISYFLTILQLERYTPILV